VTATLISGDTAVIASTLDKIATEIRHLQRTEVREAEEYFSEKQKRFVAMPHKRESGDQRADQRTGSRSAFKRASRIRKRPAVA